MSKPLFEFVKVAENEPFPWPSGIYGYWRQPTNACLCAQREFENGEPGNGCWFLRPAESPHMKALVKKYEFYVESINKDVESKQPEGAELDRLQNLALRFGEVLTDLKSFRPAESPDAGRELIDAADEREVLIHALDETRKLFEGRKWIMDGRGCYPYNDDRYKQEVRYLWDEFDEIFKAVYQKVKSKSFEYRDRIKAETRAEILAKSGDAGREGDTNQDKKQDQNAVALILREIERYCHADKKVNVKTLERLLDFINGLPTSLPDTNVGDMPAGREIKNEDK